MATFLRLKLSRDIIIAANIGQVMVNLKLWHEMTQAQI